MISQCFSSPGNPIGGTANTGILHKNALRVITFYRYSISDRYFEGDQKVDMVKVDKAIYNYVGTILGYGISNKLTLETEFGYFINKKQWFNENLNLVEPLKEGYGFSNAVISAKLNIYKNAEKRFGITTSAGAKIPMRQHALIVNNTELSTDLQPSTGSYGIVIQTFILKEKPFQALRFFLLNRCEFNFASSPDFFLNGVQQKFGNMFYTSFIISKHLHFRHEWLTENWTAILQIRNEVRAKDRQDGEIMDESGNCSFFVSPQLNYTHQGKWNISALLDFPVYQYLNGVQLAGKFAFSVSITRDFIRKEDK
ncbi:MAG: hypothetical protein K8S00_11870 [Bacteroidales bacterium]|nr:hypothetical protein [Bacteroidales bacterium]